MVAALQTQSKIMHVSTNDCKLPATFWTTAAQRWCKGAQVGDGGCSAWDGLQLMQCATASPLRSAKAAGGRPAVPGHGGPACGHFRPCSAAIGLFTARCPPPVCRCIKSPARHGEWPPCGAAPAATALGGRGGGAMGAGRCTGAARRRTCSEHGLRRRHGNQRGQQHHLLGHWEDGRRGPQQHSSGEGNEGLPRPSPPWAASRRPSLCRPDWLAARFRCYQPGRAARLLIQWAATACSSSRAKIARIRRRTTHAGPGDHAHARFACRSIQSVAPCAWLLQMSDHEDHGHDVHCEFYMLAPAVCCSFAAKRLPLACLPQPRTHRPMHAR